MTALEPAYLEAPAQISGQELRTAFEGLQEGVVGAGDLKVTAGGGTREVIVAAGVALVQGDAVPDQGLYRARNDANVSSNTATAGAFEAGGIPAADATNPRVDQVVWRVYDASHDGSGQRKARPEVVAGTAAAGATLDNRNGAAALPAGAVRLADVLVPAGATTISAGNVRDRRPWARGAYRRIVRNANAAAGSDYTRSANANLGEIDPTNLKPRLELSGVPLRVGLYGRITQTSALGTQQYAPWVDGAGPDGMTATAGVFTQDVPLNEQQWVGFVYELVPAAGSRQVSWAWRATAGVQTLFARADIPVVMAVGEIVRQNASND